MITISRDLFVRALDSIDTIMKDMNEGLIATIRLSGNGETLNVAGTDGIIYIVKQMKYEGLPVEWSLPLTKLYKMAKLCKDTITVEEIEAEQFSISSGHASWTLKADTLFGGIDFFDEGVDMEPISRNTVQDIQKLIPLLDQKNRESVICLDCDNMFVQHEVLTGMTTTATNNAYVFERIPAKVLVSAFRDSEDIQIGYSADDTAVIVQAPEARVFIMQMSSIEIPEVTIQKAYAGLIVLEQLEDAIKAGKVTAEDTMTLRTDITNLQMTLQTGNVSGEMTSIVMPATYGKLAEDVVLQFKCETFFKAVNLINNKQKVLLLCDGLHAAVLTDTDKRYNAYFAIEEVA